MNPRAIYAFRLLVGRAVVIYCERWRGTCRIAAFAVQQACEIHGRCTTSLQYIQPSRICLSADMDQGEADQHECNCKRPRISSCVSQEISAHRECQPVPAPIRFVRRPSKDQPAQDPSSASILQPSSICCDLISPVAIRIDDDVWRFCTPSSQANLHSKYYIAHRQHIGAEIREETISLGELANTPEHWNRLVESLCDIPVNKND